MTRKMAIIRKIEEIKAIPAADKIVAYRVGGWWVVDSIDKYIVGDLAVYLEIDSWVPTELAPFLSKGKEPREFEGIKGERLRTVKLRGQLSQGLLLDRRIALDHVAQIEEGMDVSELLNIVKWERPMNAQLAGMAKGNFPTQIPKTDQERVQNLNNEIASAVESGLQFEVTEKLEGSSMTCYLIDGVFGVCSRNLDLKETEDNTFWQVARRDDIEDKMKICRLNDFAIQGELIGPGIQGNIYKLNNPEFRVFDMYDIKAGAYLYPHDRRAQIMVMGLQHAPLLLVDKDLGVGSIDEILQSAEGKSKLNDRQEREGIVFKEVNGGMSFKAISNSYLLGNNE
jgi:RNA ligase (TIGR02306 family)